MTSVNTKRKKNPWGDLKLSGTFIEKYQASRIPKDLFTVICAHGDIHT